MPRPLPHPASAEPTPIGLNRSARKALTKQRILQVARDRFIELGFESVTTRDIADAAGVAVGTVFSHFPDKHLLLRSVLSDDIARVVQSAREQVPTEAGWREAALVYAQHLYGFHGAQRAMSVALLKEVLFDPAYLNEQAHALKVALTERMSTPSGAPTHERREALLQSAMANYMHVLITGLSDEGTRAELWLERLRMRLALLPD